MARRKEVTSEPDFPYDPKLDELFETSTANEIIELVAQNVRKWLQKTGDIFGIPEGWEVTVEEPNGWTARLMFHGPRDLDQDGMMEGMMEAKFFPPRKEASQEQPSLPTAEPAIPAEDRPAEEAQTAV